MDEPHGADAQPVSNAHSRILATAARELADSLTYVTFLAPTTDSCAGDERLVRVSALDCARPPLDHLRAAVLLSPPGDLRAHPDDGSDLAVADSRDL